jgi:hypothetical protein
MKTAKIIFWVKTPSDSRFTAGSVGTIIVPQSQAVALAKEIDAYGDAAFADGFEQYKPELPTGNKVAVGHGVTIQYESGRRREIRA